MSDNHSDIWAFYNTIQAVEKVISKFVFKFVIHYVTETFDWVLHFRILTIL